MEPKTKYQYTYFIYPYVVKENKYDSYLLKLLKKKQCSLKIFQKEKDLELYTYFLPKIRQYLFWSFEFHKSDIKKLDTIELDTKAAVLAKYPCMMFDYDLGEDIQGKVGQKNGIFFHIRKIQIVCFKTGICFLLFKTTLEGENTLSDVCNFNYKFRDINSELASLKDYENIKIQTDMFKDSKEFSSLIEELAGNNQGAKELNLDTERFITYSYACIGQENWNDTTDQELLQKSFYRFSNIKPASYMVDSNETDIESFQKAIGGKYLKYGFNPVGSSVLASDINTQNYTRLPFAYENSYLYTYLLTIYKKIYLKKINLEFNKEQHFLEAKKKFIDFTQEIWIQEVTNDSMGNQLLNKWEEVTSLQQVYMELKSKYDVLYKNANIEKTSKANKWIVAILATLAVINIINCIAIFSH